MYLKKKKTLWSIFCILCIGILCALAFVGCSNKQQTQPSTDTRQTVEYKLDKNVDLQPGQYINFRGADKNIVLDLNGYCIFASRATAIYALNGANVTIKDSNPNATHYLAYDQATKAYTQYSQIKPANGIEATATSHHIAGSYITVQGGLITGANSGINGGAIVVGNVSETNANGESVAYQGPMPTVILQGGTIAGNTANGYGGAVYIGSNAKFVMQGGAVVGNHSTSYGGGVFGAVQSTVQLSGGTIAYNSAGRAGGGVYLQGSDYLKSTNLTLENSIQILNNNADHGGGVGGIVCNVDMKGGTVQGNTAREGAGFDIYAGAMYMSGGSIKNNTAQTRGGGILFAATEENWAYVQEQSTITGKHILEITGGDIAENTAAKYAAIATSKVVVNMTKEMYTKIKNSHTNIQADNVMQFDNQTTLKIFNPQKRTFVSFIISVAIGTLLVVGVIWVISCFI